ncbi:hypothetical protein D4R75_05135 [bacterium]|nr:MAG: hypothetical protein D4R75_05135 [bacterium]
MQGYFKCKSCGALLCYGNVVRLFWIFVIASAVSIILAALLFQHVASWFGFKIVNWFFFPILFAIGMGLTSVILWKSARAVKPDQQSDTMIGPVSKVIDWKWVGISFASYLLFYLLPILIVRRPYTHYHMGEFERLFVAVWIFGGVITIAAVIGYFSKGVTLIEPVIASIGTILLWAMAFNLLIARRAHIMSRDIRELFVVIGVIFLLSLIGAWLGESAQKLWRKEPPPSA